MSEIEKTIQTILEVDDTFSKKVEEAKLEAKKIVDSAKSEIENYRNQKEREINDFKLSLESKFSEEIKNYRSSVFSRVEVDKTALLEILKSKKHEAIDRISSEVIREIVGSILSK